MKASCQSLTSQFLKVVGDFVNDYQALRKTAAKIVGASVIPGKPGPEKELNQLIDQAIDLETKLLQAYGVAVGEGRGKIGPRHLIIPTKKVTGNLLTERTFIVTPSIFDRVTIIIRKTGGKAGADIVACAKYANGSHFDEKNRAIDKGKESEGSSVKFVFSGMAEKILTLHLVKTGFPTDKFNYSVSIEGEFDEDEVRKLGSSGTTIMKAVPAK
jgi:hypothetical protein